MIIIVNIIMMELRDIPQIANPLPSKLFLFIFISATIPRTIPITEKIEVKKRE